MSCQILHLKRIVPLVQVLLHVTYNIVFQIVVLILLPYWVAPYLIAAGYTACPSIPILGFCVLMHTLGVAIMMVSGCLCYIELKVDAQKYYTLQNKKGLIMDGMYKYIRSPNYLGEVMIYASYAIVANVGNSGVI